MNNSDKFIRQPFVELSDEIINISNIVDYLGFINLNREEARLLYIELHKVLFPENELQDNSRSR